MTSKNPLSLHYAALREWEKSVGVFDYKAEGVPLWRLVRNSVLIQDIVKKGLEQVHRSEQPRPKDLFFLAAGTVRSSWHLLRLKKAQFLFWGSSRRQMISGKWVDALTDPIIDALPPETTLTLERPLQGRHANPAKTPRIGWYDAPKVLSRLWARCGPRLNKDTRIIISELAVLLARKFDMSTRKMETRLVREYKAFCAERWFATIVLKRTKPTAVFVVNRWINSGVLAACSEMGIRTYELQHGAVGKEGLKYVTPFDPKIDPSGFLTFGNDWKASQWGLPKDRIHNIGSPFIWTQRQSLSQPPSGKKIMLVSQPNFAKLLDKEFSHFCTALPNQKFLLQLHPQDRQNWRSNYTCALHDNVEIASERTPLYESFVDCQAVLGQDSTVLLEASFFNLKVGLLDLPNTLEGTAKAKLGTFNFFEVRSVEQLRAMLDSPRRNEAISGNGYFDEFQLEVLESIVGIRPSPKTEQF